MEALKKKYNEELKVLFKADHYITNNPKCLDDPKLIDRYNSIIKSLSHIINDYEKATGTAMEVENRLNGF